MEYYVRGRLPFLAPSRCGTSFLHQKNVRHARSNCLDFWQLRLMIHAARSDSQHLGPHERHNSGICQVARAGCAFLISGCSQSWADEVSYSVCPTSVDTLIKAPSHRGDKLAGHKANGNLTGFVKTAARRLNSRSLIEYLLWPQVPYEDRIPRSLAAPIHTPLCRLPRQEDSTVAARTRPITPRV